MFKYVPMTAVVLAGGQSLRMGYDKALLPLWGKTLLENILERISPFFAEALVVVEDAKKVRGLQLCGARVLEDAVKQKGPLAGIYTGLCRASHRFSMVFSCDMPFIDGACILKLMQAGQNEEDFEIHGFVTQDGRREPFPGVYAKSTRFLIRLLLDQKERSMKRLFQVTDVHWIRAPEGSGRAFQNLNRIEEYWEAVDPARKCPQ